jgi:hypothetical protein
MLERQVAYTLGAKGRTVTPQAVREHTRRLIDEGGDVNPWGVKRAMPDYRGR